MNCRELMDIENAGDCPSGLRLKAALHRLCCPRCAARAARFERARRLLAAAFPPAPSLEEAVMERLEAFPPEACEGLAGEVSFRSWVVTGVVVLLSLCSAFFGMTGAQIAAPDWTGFLLPLGITVGLIVSCYGALFIGTHLKELSDRFNLWGGEEK